MDNVAIPIQSILFYHHDNWVDGLSLKLCLFTFLFGQYFNMQYPSKLLWGAGKTSKKDNNCFNIQPKLAEISFNNKEFTKRQLVVNGGRRALMTLVCMLLENVVGS